MPTRFSSDLDDLIRRLAALDAVSPNAARVRSDLFAAAFHRTRSGRDRPVVALIGGTGVGKSSVVNRLIGADVTATSFRRTFTAGPVAVTAGDLPRGFLDLPHIDADTVAGPPRGQADRVVLVRRADALLADVTLMDAPDVDGERPDHHAVADRVFRWADAVLFVVTPEKYQMTELQPYYRLAKRYAVPAVYVMNKADSAAVVDDYGLLLRRSGIDDARVRVVPRDDSTWQAPADTLLRPGDLQLPPAADPAGLRQRTLDATERAGDQVVLPLVELRQSIDRVRGSIQSFVGDAIEVNVRPFTRQLERRMQERSVLYLMGPQRIIDRVRSVPSVLVRLPKSLWDWSRGGDLNLAPPQPTPRGEPPDFAAIVVEQFQSLQSRIQDVMAQSPRLADREGTWKIDPAKAATIADEEIGELRQWLETKWNKNPRDTALLMKVLRVIPGGSKITGWLEATPYLLAISCVATSHLLGHIDVLVLGGYSAFTWLTEKLSNEVAARTRQANAAIAERYETLAEEQIAAAVAWLDTLAPPAAVLDGISTLIDRVRAEA